MTGPRHKEVTLAQLLPNMLTVGAICAGVTAIRMGVQGDYVRAVQLLLIAGVLATFAPVVGHVGAGLIGGFVAGYVAGGGLLSGTWHGLLAGSVSGVVVTLLLAAFGGLVGLAGGPVGSLLGGAGVLVVGLFLTFLFAIDSALAGAIGGVLGD